MIESGPPGPLGLHGLDGLKGVKGDMGTRGVSLPLVTLAIMDSLEIQLLALTFWYIVLFIVCRASKTCCCLVSRVSFQGRLNSLF